MPTNSTLEVWNAFDAATAAATILPCNGSQTWAENITALRPFATPYDLTCTADILWRALPPEAHQLAFDSHPRIGEHQAKSATPASLALSATEQSAANPTPDTAAALAAANRIYEQKFNRIFIICATNKSAEQILTILHQRLNNDPATELSEAIEQQRQITQLRLRKWLAESHP